MSAGQRAAKPGQLARFNLNSRRACERPAPVAAETQTAGANPGPGDEPLGAGDADHPDRESARSEARALAAAEREMRGPTRIELAGVAAIAVAVLAGPASSSAADRVGTECTATSVGGSNTTAVQAVKDGASPLPVQAPAKGVATRWTVKLSLGEPDAVPQQLKVLRRIGEDFNQYETVAESAYEVVVNGTNVFSTRIPVEAGSHFGIAGSPSGGSLSCGGAGPEALTARYPANPAIGTTQTYSLTIGAETPVAVDVEPDADGDGYGDETQDGCPSDAAVQDPCQVPLGPAVPFPSLDAHVLAGKRSALILAAANTAATVRATGTVNVPNARRKRARKRSGRARGSRLLRLGGAAQTIADGRLARLRLRFNRSLRAALRKRRPGQKLTLRIRVAATNAAGTAATSLTVKLPGQKRRRR